MDERGAIEDGPEAAGTPASEARAERASGAQLRPLLLAAAGAWLTVDLLGGLEVALPAVPGEGSVLRWLRVLAAHPVRAKVGLTAIGWGAIPRNSPTIPTSSLPPGASWKGQ